MSPSTPPSAEKPSSASRGRWPADRITLAVLLAVALAVLGLDLPARLAARKAHMLLGDQLASQPAALAPEQVHEMLGRSPVEIDQTADELIEIYAWPGVLRTYRLRVAYPKGPSPTMTKVY
jgi:hypothetical protein